MKKLLHRRGDLFDLRYPSYEGLSNLRFRFVMESEGDGAIIRGLEISHYIDNPVGTSSFAILLLNIYLT